MNNTFETGNSSSSQEDIDATRNEGKDANQEGPAETQGETPDKESLEGDIDKSWEIKTTVNGIRIDLGWNDDSDSYMLWLPATKKGDSTDRAIALTQSVDDAKSAYRLASEQAGACTNADDLYNKLKDSLGNAEGGNVGGDEKSPADTNEDKRLEARENISEAEDLLLAWKDADPDSFHKSFNDVWNRINQIIDRIRAGGDPRIDEVLRTPDNVSAFHVLSEVDSKRTADPTYLIRHQEVDPAIDAYMKMFREMRDNIF